MKRKTKAPIDDRPMPWEPRPVSRERWQKHRAWLMGACAAGSRPEEWWLYEQNRERPENLPEGKEFEAVPWGWSPGDRATIQARWPSPGDLFARIGDPKHLQIPADFLIGWRVGILTGDCYLCPDPPIVAGVQARSSGDLYLSRRNPDLSWERLLSAPIAFDEPAVSALFP